MKLLIHVKRLIKRLQIGFTVVGAVLLAGCAIQPVQQVTYDFQRATNCPEDVYNDTTWLPDGVRLLFVYGRIPNPGPTATLNLYTLNMQTGGLVQLTYNQDVGVGFPVISPDGKAVGMLITQHDATQVAIAGMDGSGITHITQPYYLDYPGVWSLDSTQFLYSRYTADTFGIESVYLDRATGNLGTMSYPVRPTHYPGIIF